MWQRERTGPLSLSYCMTAASPPTPGDILLVFMIGYSSWLQLIGASYCGITGAFSPDRESIQRVADMLPCLRDGLVASQHWSLGQPCLMFNVLAPGHDVLMELWVGSEEGVSLSYCVSPG